MTFTLEELALLADLTDPMLNHARIDGAKHLDQVTNLHRRIGLEARRQSFHQAVANTPLNHG